MMQRKLFGSTPIVQATSARSLLPLRRKHIGLIGNLLSIIALCSSSLPAQDPKAPEFFGIYIKTKAGNLIELQAEPVYQYKAFERDWWIKTNSENDESPVNLLPLKAAQQPSKQYVVSKPAIEVLASDIAGFYVYGDFNVDSFFITQFNTSTLPADAVVIAKFDTGPGIKNPGNYVDLELGWRLDKAFRYVEEKPKLYWIAPRENVDLGSSEASFLAISVGENGKIFPFSLMQEEHTILLHEARKLENEGKLDEALTTARKSLAKQPSAEALSHIAYCAFYLGRKEEAWATLTDALQHYPEDMDLIRVATYVTEDAEDYEACIRYVKGPVENKTLFSFPYNTLASAYVKKGENIDEAISLAKRALELAPVDSEKSRAFYTISEAYLIKGDLKSAMSYCQQGLNGLTSFQAVFRGQKAKIEFLEKEMDSTVKGQTNGLSAQRLAALLAGTWYASLTESADTRLKHIDVRLVVRSSPDLADIEAVYSFKSATEINWGSQFEMKGRASVQMGTVMLLGEKKIRNLGPPWTMGNLFGEISKNGSSINWIEYGFEGEFKKEQ